MGHGKAAAKRNKMKRQAARKAAEDADKAKSVQGGTHLATPRVTEVNEALSYLVAEGKY